MHAPTIHFESRAREIEDGIRRRLARPTPPERSAHDSALRRFRARRAAFRTTQVAGHAA